MHPTGAILRPRQDPNRPAEPMPGGKGHQVVTLSRTQLVSHDPRNPEFVPLGDDMEDENIPQQRRPSAADVLRKAKPAGRSYTASNPLDAMSAESLLTIDLIPAVPEAALLDGYARSMDAAADVQGGDAAAIVFGRYDAIEEAAPSTKAPSSRVSSSGGVFASLAAMGAAEVSIPEEAAAAVAEPAHTAPPAPPPPPPIPARKGSVPTADAVPLTAAGANVIDAVSEAVGAAARQRGVSVDGLRQTVIDQQTYALILNGAFGDASSSYSSSSAAAAAAALGAPRSSFSTMSSSSAASDSAWLESDSDAGMAALLDFTDDPSAFSLVQSGVALDDAAIVAAALAKDSPTTVVAAGCSSGAALAPTQLQQQLAALTSHVTFRPSQGYTSRPGCASGEQGRTLGDVVETVAAMRRQEGKRQPDPAFMSRQTITAGMREILIDWLVDVHVRFNMNPLTFHHTINILDRFLSVAQVASEELQLAGCAALCIAAKFEEVRAPQLKDYAWATDYSYSKREIQLMEARVLQALLYSMPGCTSLGFAMQYIGILLNTTADDLLDHRVSSRSSASSSASTSSASSASSASSSASAMSGAVASIFGSAFGDYGTAAALPSHLAQQQAQAQAQGGQHKANRLKFLVEFICEAACQSADYVKFPPSLLGAAALCLALQMLKMERPQCWTVALSLYSGYSLHDLIPACEFLRDWMNAMSWNRKLTASRDRYATSRYLGVGYLAPPHDLKLMGKADALISVAIKRLGVSPAVLHVVGRVRADTGSVDRVLVSRPAIRAAAGAGPSSPIPISPSSSMTSTSSTSTSSSEVSVPVLTGRLEYLVRWRQTPQEVWKQAGTATLPAMFYTGNGLAVDSAAMSSAREIEAAAGTGTAATSSTAQPTLGLCVHRWLSRDALSRLPGGLGALASYDMETATSAAALSGPGGAVGSSSALKQGKGRRRKEAAAETGCQCAIA